MEGIVVRITLLHAILGAMGIVFVSWALYFLYLRARHQHAVRRAKILAERLRQPANTFVKIEEQTAALEELTNYSDIEAAVAAVRPLLSEFDATVRTKALEVLRKTRALDRWVRTVKHGRLPVRLRAIDALGDVGDERAIDTLIDLLGEEQSEIIEAVSRAIIRRDYDYAYERLADAFSSPHPRLAETAAAVLASFGKSATEPAMRCLSSLHPRARRLAVQVLRTVGDEQAVPLLLPLLTSEPDAKVRIAVLEAVMHLQAERAHLAVREVAHTDPQWAVRARAYYLLAGADVPGAKEFLFDQLLAQGTPERHAEEHPQGEESPDHDASVQAVIVAGLQQLGVSPDDITRAQRKTAPEPSEEEEETLPSDDSSITLALTARDPALRISVLQSLSASGPSAMGFLRRALRDPDPSVRAEAARIVGRLGTVSSLQTLSECLLDPDQSVRLAVVAAVRAIVTRDAAREPQP